MIARIWRGAVHRKDGDAYAKYMQATGIAGSTRTPGNRAALMLRREVGDRCEFVMLTLWDSMEAVTAFAGTQPEKAVFYPEDDRYLIDRDLTVDHYESIRRLVWASARQHRRTPAEQRASERGIEHNDHMDPPAPLRHHYASWSWSPLPSAAPDSQATTWRLDDPDTGQVRFLKTASSRRFPRLLDEAARMRWAQAHLPVPTVLDSGTDQSVDWLVTAALAGRDATDERLRADPGELVALLAKELRRFHAAPVAACPFDLVVCHGDYCLPNVLVADGRASGFVDLGELGVADRWWDLAVGSWSITWNLGPGWEESFLHAYGVSRDEGRIAFFRLLYDLVV
jgi:kanamycin kinase